MKDEKLERIARVIDDNYTLKMELCEILKIAMFHAVLFGGYVVVFKLLFGAP